MLLCEEVLAPFSSLRPLITQQLDQLLAQLTAQLGSGPQTRTPWSPTDDYFWRFCWSRCAAAATPGISAAACLKDATLGRMNTCPIRMGQAISKDVYMRPAGWCLSVRRVAGDSPDLPAGMTAACHLVAPVLAAADTVAPHVNGMHLAGFLGGGMGSARGRWAP
jgi:hypothetical protein